MCSYLTDFWMGVISMLKNDLKRNVVDNLELASKAQNWAREYHLLSAAYWMVEYHHATS